MQLLTVVLAVPLAQQLRDIEAHTDAALAKLAAPSSFVEESSLHNLAAATAAKFAAARQAARATPMSFAQVDSADQDDSMRQLDRKLQAAHAAAMAKLDDLFKQKGAAPSSFIENFHDDFSSAGLMKELATMEQSSKEENQALRKQLFAEMQKARAGGATTKEVAALASSLIQTSEIEWRDNSKEYGQLLATLHARDAATVAKVQQLVQQARQPTVEARKSGPTSFAETEAVATHFDRLSSAVSAMEQAAKAAFASVGAAPSSLLEEGAPFHHRHVDLSQSFADIQDTIVSTSAAIKDSDAAMKPYLADSSVAAKAEQASPLHGLSDKFAALASKMDAELAKAASSRDRARASMKLAGASSFLQEAALPPAKPPSFEELKAELQSIRSQTTAELQQYPGAHMRTD